MAILTDIDMKKKLTFIAIAWLISMLLLFFWRNEWQAVFLAIDLFGFGLYAIIDLWKTDSEDKNWQALANRDELTGLLNRRGLLAANIKAPYCLLMLDIDKFKTINDTQGHTIGDEVLKDLAHTLTRNTRQGDLCVRYGGDEFIVVLVRADKTTAQAFIQRFYTQLTVDKSPPYAVSIGYADSNEAESLDAIIVLADNNLRQQKSHSQNLPTK